MYEINVPETSNAFRAWKIKIMPYLGTFDSSGLLLAHLGKAMKARGAAQ